MTAEKPPGRFWVFNNGITALVHDFECLQANKLKITGLSIVNGAQTTGAIGSLKKPPQRSALIQARFVKCGESATVEDIIKYNNSQNLVEAADFRSNDAVQKRLRTEFESIPKAEYQGCRRGGHQDLIRRPGNVIPSDTAAQSLAAFHNNPVTAYNRKSQIWVQDELYSKYFSEETHAEHIVFAYSLLRCIQEKKLSLARQAGAGNGLQEGRKQELEFLKKRGATFLLMSAIAACIEILIDAPAPNRFRLSFALRVSPDQAEKLWEPIVSALLPFHAKLTPAVESSLASPDEAIKSIADFKSMVDSTRTVMSGIYKKFAEKVVTRT